MKAWTVVGYAYKADIYCPGCVLEEVLKDQGIEGHGLSFVVEEALNRIARTLGMLDNEHGELDEATYDSDEFPKVIFADQEEGEHCSQCHEALVEHDCPAECY